MTTLIERQIVQRDRQNAANASYNDFAGALKNPIQIPLPTEDLVKLTLSAASVAEDATAGTVIGAIQNKTTGSTLSIFPANAKFAISGTNLVKGATAVTEGTETVTIRETMATALNTPSNTTLTVTVTAA